MHFVPNGLLLTYNIILFFHLQTVLVLTELIYFRYGFRTNYCLWSVIHNAHFLWDRYKECSYLQQ